MVAYAPHSVNVVGVIIAAGPSQGAGSGPDALCELGGRPLLAHALHTLVAGCAADRLVASVVVVPTGTAPQIRRTLDELGGTSGQAARGAHQIVVEDTTATVPGFVPVGAPAASASSVLGALSREHPEFMAVLGRAEAVLVHDVRRPLAPPDVAERVLAAVRGGAAAAVPVVEVIETIKEIDPQGWIARTVSRDDLWHVQTPQAVRTSALSESPGAEPVTVTGDFDGFLLGGPADLAFAEAILRARATA